MSPPYTLAALPAFGKDLERTPHQMRQRIAQRINQLAANPRASGVKAIMGKPGYYRIRIGDYRLVYGIDDTTRLVTLIIAGKREDIYERMERRI